MNSRGGKTYETLIMLQEHKVLIAEKIWLGIEGASLIKLAPSTEEPPKEKGANGKNI